MKIFTSKFWTLLIFSTAFLCACSSNEKKVEQNTKEYTSTYVCPMHCEGSGSEEPGVCPVCNMDYVKNPEKEKESFNSSQKPRRCIQLTSN